MRGLAHETTLARKHSLRKGRLRRGCAGADLGLTGAAGEAQTRPLMKDFGRQFANNFSDPNAE
eukprot:7646313-Pyramimonas_sp.AAC.1